MAGGILAARWTPRNAGTAVICANAAAGLQLACLAYAAPVPLIGLAAFATGAGYAFGGVVWISTLQRNVPNETLGRVLSLDMLSSYALMPLGVAAAPVMVNTLGSRMFLLAALTALLTATVLPLFFQDVRMMGNAPLTTSRGTPTNSNSQHAQRHVL
ncbi:hypothetical protein [Streptomyces sp. NPDC090994]|uniref:hypothetical protein n=1 Tax=Streptomyces sp. NPDC090994 TaxID=3365969 RepID=UPI0038065FA2